MIIQCEYKWAPDAKSPAAASVSGGSFGPCATYMTRLACIEYIYISRVEKSVLLNLCSALNHLRTKGGKKL